MLIGFTGTQTGMTKWQKEELRKILVMKECTSFAHGDCIGSDVQAAELAFLVGIRDFIIHPPLHDHKRAYWLDPEKRARQLIPRFKLTYQGVEITVEWREPKPYLERNRNIVDEAALMIATPKEFKHTLRSGTWSTIRYAWKTKKDDIIIIPPIERPEDSESDRTS